MTELVATAHLSCIKYYLLVFQKQKVVSRNSIEVKYHTIDAALVEKISLLSEL